MMFSFLPLRKVFCLLVLFICKGIASDDGQVGAREARTTITIGTINRELNDLSKFAPYVVCYEDVELIGTIEWNTPRILEIHTTSQLIFPANFKIIYKGKGGGLIIKSVFDASEQEPFVFPPRELVIDFSESDVGDVSIFYNPHKGTHPHKYQNPFDFSPYIRLAADTFLHAFMWVNVKPDRYSYDPTSIPTDFDFSNISQNLAGSYALSGPLVFNLSSKKDRNTIFKIPNFAGVLNYNRFEITLSGWNWSQYEPREYIFGGINGKHFMARSLPYEKAITFSPFWQGFPDQEEAQKKEYKHTQKAHEKFFVRPLSTERTVRLTSQFVKEYDDKKLSLLNIEGIPGRTRILLLGSITALKLEKFDSEKERSAWWRTLQKTYDAPDGTQYPYEEYNDLYPTTYVFGGINHKLTNQHYSNREKPGYAYYDQLGDYDEIERIYMDICSRICQKEVARLSRMSRISGNSIKSEDLFRIGYSGTPDQAVTDTANLNRINFLLDHEVASRLVRIRPVIARFDLLPIGTAIARMQTLVTDRPEWMCSSRFFLKTSPYHCFTNEVSTREGAIKKISHDFRKQSQQNRRRFLPADSIPTRWEAEHPEGLIVATQEQIHQELLSEYGGGYESSGEEYDDSSAED